MSVGIRFMATEEFAEYDDESNAIGQALIKLKQVKNLEILSLTRERYEANSSESRMIIVYVDDKYYETFRAECILAYGSYDGNVHTISYTVLKLGRNIIDMIETAACDFYLCIFPSSIPKNQFADEHDSWEYDDTVYQLKLERYAEWLSRELYLIPYQWNFSSSMLHPRRSLSEYKERPRYYFYESTFCNG